MKKVEIHNFLKSLTDILPSEWTGKEFSGKLIVDTPAIKGSISGIQVDKGIIAVVNRFKVLKPVYFCSLTDKEYLKLSFYIDADLEQKNSFTKESQRISSGSCRIIYFKKKSRNIIVPHAHINNSLDIILKPALLRKTIQHLSSNPIKNRIQYFMNHVQNVSLIINAPSQALKIAREIIDLSEEDKLCNFLKIRSLVYEILSQIISGKIQPEGERGLNLLNKDDIPKLLHAKKYLESQLNNPPTLKQLSKIVGLNEFKLKYGFRTIFNTTVHSYSIDQRLCASCNLLRNSDCLISEIGYDVGFQCPSKFIQTFRKKFGVTPGEYRRNYAIQPCHKI